MNVFNITCKINQLPLIYSNKGKLVELLDTCLLNKELIKLSPARM